MNEALTNFKNIQHSSKEDWEKIVAVLTPYKFQLHERIMKHLMELAGDFAGFPVDRLTHSLQTASLAFDDGRDTEYVVCALLHDIGDTLGSFNHPEYAATLLQPFVSELNYNMVKYHGVFQSHYYGHHIGLPPGKREQFRDQDHYQYTIDFCEKYDAPAFDQDAKFYPVEFFAPMVKEVFTQPKAALMKNVFKKEEA
ncbi:HD domain-containing protein [Acidovorax sp. SRB_24]|uniref:HD domain-containing protein n=1 Tax=Acidovorax sp. SRB_24 TaxID=1962700 RepID=UPI00353034F2